MVTEKLEQELNKKILRSIYMFYGEEKYLIENYLNKIKKNFGQLQEGINYCYLDEANINNIISELETPAFGFEKKLIVIKKAGLLVGKKKTSKNKKNQEDISKATNGISEKLAEYIENNFNLIKDTVVLVIIEEKSEKCNLLDVLKKYEETENIVAICECQKLKLNQIVFKLKEICSKYNVVVDESTLAYLVEISGMSMQNLLNEIRKLIEYVGNNGKITKKEVDLLATPEIDNIIFNLTDSLGVKDTKRAIETLHDLIYMKESLQGIMINLYRHFKKLYFVKLSEKDYNVNLIELLELKPTQTFLISKYKRQAQAFSEKELRLFLREMLKLDNDYKTGNIDLQIGVEVLIAGIKK